MKRRTFHNRDQAESEDFIQLVFYRTSEGTSRALGSLSFRAQGLGLWSI